MDEKSNKTGSLGIGKSRKSKQSPPKNVINSGGLGKLGEGIENGADESHVPQTA